MIHEIEQNTDEWMQLRMGKITASNFATIMASYGKAFGNPAIQYAQRVAIEGKTNVTIETFQSEWMEKGIELEQDAREAYQMATFTDVLPGGFAELDRFGSSSDGLAGPGMIEIKCVKYNTHFATIERNSADPAYAWQYQGQMLVAKLKFVDYTEYCEKFPFEKAAIHRSWRYLSG